MIVVNLCGGLGNQMFQYAFGRYLSLKYDLPLVLNKEVYEKGLSNRPYALDIFKLNSKIISDHAYIKYEALQREGWMLSEAQFEYDEAATNPIGEDEDKDDVVLVLSGYWQTEKYFQPIVHVLREDFSFVRPLTGRWLEMQRQIQSVNAVMVNVRRGDYLEKLDYHGVVDIAYIERAMDFYMDRVTEPVFFLFSDGMDWCRKHITGPGKIVFVNETYYDEKYQSYLQLMASCKYFVIANSAFSWWAAWLGTFKEKIVVAPQKWFATEALDTRDILPEGWISL